MRTLTLKLILSVALALASGASSVSSRAVTHWRSIGKQRHLAVSKIWLQSDLFASRRVYGAYESDESKGLVSFGAGEGLTELYDGGRVLAFQRSAQDDGSERLSLVSALAGSGETVIMTRTSGSGWRPALSLGSELPTTIGMQGLLSGEVWVYGAWRGLPRAIVFDGTDWRETDVSALPHDERILAILAIGPRSAFAILGSGIAEYDGAHWQMYSRRTERWVTAFVQGVRVFGVNGDGQVFQWLLGTKEPTPIALLRGAPKGEGDDRRWIWNAISPTEIWEYRENGADGIVSTWNGSKWTDVIAERGLLASDLALAGEGPVWVQSNRGLLRIEDGRLQ